MEIVFVHNKVRKIREKRLMSKVVVPILSACNPYCVPRQRDNEA